MTAEIFTKAQALQLAARSHDSAGRALRDPGAVIIILVSAMSLIWRVTRLSRTQLHTTPSLQG
jgi:hypothetical protein